MGRYPAGSGLMLKSSLLSGAPSLKAWSPWRPWKPGPSLWSG
nr:MAG TPA: hypothetical protein [Caudoviricetes sp.]